MIPYLAHAEEPVAVRGAGDYVGSPMYGVIAEHEGVFVFAFLFLLIGALVPRLANRSARARRVLSAYRLLDSPDRLLVWLVGLSTAIHAGLVFGHELGAWTILYAAGAMILAYVTRLALTAGSRRRIGLGLAASIIAYAAVAIGGEPPDQVGLATKLVELLALAIVLAPVRTTRARSMAASGGVVGLAVVLAASAWAGAFASGGGHHLGDVPAPGVLLPAGEDRLPTRHEMFEADELHAVTSAALARYRDPAVAAADGYRVDGMFGTDFHAENPYYKADGRILDPERPETLVYAVGASGPVLLGAMFEMDEIGAPGPAVGGPLTVWHAHDHICLSLTPPALVGLVSPFGSCPVGAVAVPITPEMIHVWTLPGVPDPFGDIDEGWLRDYLAAD